MPSLKDLDRQRAALWGDYLNSLGDIRNQMFDNIEELVLQPLIDGCIMPITHIERVDWSLVFSVGVYIISIEVNGDETMRPYVIEVQSRPGCKRPLRMTNAVANISQAVGTMLDFMRVCHEQNKELANL